MYFNHQGGHSDEAESNIVLMEVIIKIYLKLLLQFGHTILMYQHILEVMEQLVLQYQERI